MEPKMHGQAVIRRNGQILVTDEDATLEPGGIVNNPRMIGRDFAYNQSWTPGKVTCKTPVTKDVSLTELQQLTDLEIAFESDTGTTWIIRNAVQAGNLSLTGGNSGGTTELTFQGKPAVEMKSNG